MARTEPGHLRGRTRRFRLLRLLKSRSFEVVFPYQARDALAAGGDPLARQDRVHPRAAVASPAALVDPLDALRQRHVGLLARRGVAALPGVEAAARHAQLRAHELDGEARLLGLDEGELHRLSFEKKAAALFKKSRSIFSTRTSFRSARSSACSLGDTSLWPARAAPGSARLTHSRSAVSVRSGSLTTCCVVDGGSAPALHL